MRSLLAVGPRCRRRRRCRARAASIGRVTFANSGAASRPGRLPARRGVAAQLRLRRRHRCVPRGAEGRPVVRDGLLGRGHELQPAAVAVRRGRARAGRRWRSWGRRRRRASPRRRRRASRASCAPSRRCSGPAASPRGRPRMRRRWPRSPPRIRRTMRRRRSMRWRCWRRCRSATRRCRCGGRPARIAEKVFARSPNHPGAAHYILHAYDHRTLAARGLPAARAYAKIAPAASHALHMPAHSFLQAGLVGRSRGVGRGVVERVDRLGEAARPAGLAAATFTACRGCSTSGRSREGSRRPRRRIALVDEAMKVADGTSRCLPPNVPSVVPAACRRTRLRRAE